MREIGGVIPPLPVGHDVQHCPRVECPCGQDMTQEHLHLGEGQARGFFFQRSGRKLKPWEVSSAKIRHSGKVQCFSAKEDSYASPLA